ncbi:MAG: TrmH family RNA methyltransferase [Flavobacteriaceae bacterium]|tara:strand:- start:3106 stop:3840 length:735 start_codon:yes stop_codon:yes gene_type:complete
MLTKNQSKRILSLKQKKQRLKQGLFIVEGPKVVQEFIDSNYELVEIFSINNNYAHFEGKLTIIDEKELKKISSLVTPNTVLAVFKIPTPIEVNANGLILALDELNNPGNLGTIIRLCDWFGIKDLVCSTTTVDCYNSKTVQAAMGSHTRVNIIYLDLELFLDAQSYTMGTFMDAKASIYEMELPSSGVVVLGNEANGISDAIASKLNTRLAIPRFGLLKQTESLNVANAAAIILSEFKRRSIER